MALCSRAGIVGARVERHDGSVRFASVDALVCAEGACVWTLGGVLDATHFARLRREAPSALASFVDAGGAVAFSMPALIVTADKPAAPE